MSNKRIPKPKPEFLERMKELSYDEKDYQSYLDILNSGPRKSIRCNTIKISPEDLKKRLENKGWEVKQIWKEYPEIMIVENDLSPGELGRTFESLLGYYYIQELASMLPVLALNPKPHERVLDLCASPGSKTTQIAAKTNNTGFILANDMGLKRIKILASNLERCGVTSALVTGGDGIKLCQRLKEKGYKFDKILLDVPCSAEGTFRGNPGATKSWSERGIKRLTKLQKNLLKNVFDILDEGGEIVYSTCTHGPEENEAVVSFAKEELENVEIEKPNLPSELNFREGITSWRGNEYNEQVKNCCRLHPQDSDTEGFFVSKLRKINSNGDAEQTN